MFISFANINFSRFSYFCVNADYQKITTVQAYINVNLGMRLAIFSIRIALELWLKFINK